MYNVFLLTLQNIRLYSYSMVLRTAVIFAFLLMLMAVIAEDLHAFHGFKITSSLGLLSINFFLAFITIYIGSNTLIRDLNNNVIYILISKGISRIEIILANFLAMLSMNFVNMIVLFSIFISIIFFLGDFNHNFLIAIHMIFMELILLAAITFFLNTFTRTIVTFYSSASLYIVGHYSDILYNLETITNNDILLNGAKIFYYLIPNFNLFSDSHFIITSDSIQIDLLVPGSIYCLAYSVILLILSCFIFSKRDL